MGIIGTIVGTGEILQNIGRTSKHICRLSFYVNNNKYCATIIVPKTVQTVADLRNYIRNNSDYHYSTSSESYYFKGANVYYCGSSAVTIQIFQCLVANETGTSLSVRIGSGYENCSAVTATFEDL